MSESILTSTKKKLGVDANYEYFDEDLLIDYINMAFATLTQLGAGPKVGFAISGDSETWDSYSTDSNLVQLVKSYLYARVRYLFDPPSSSFVLDSLKKQIDEFEWRINVLVDPKQQEDA